MDELEQMEADDVAAQMNAELNVPASTVINPVAQPAAEAHVRTALLRLLPRILAHGPPVLGFLVDFEAGWKNTPYHP